MRIEKANQVYESRKSIISPSQNLKEQGDKDKIRFSFLSQSCNIRFGDQSQHLTKDIILVSDNSSAEIEIKSNKEISFSSISFNRRDFISKLSNILDEHQGEVQLDNHEEEKDLSINGHNVYPNQYQLQVLISDMVSLNGKQDGSIKNKLIKLKTESFILESLQSDLKRFYISLLGDNYQKDPISHMIQMIQNTPQQNWSVSDIAQKANVSESTLYRYFKKNLNTTPNQYLWDVKLDHAKQLLRERLELNISQIGYNVGIQNPFYFSKIFKQHVGKSPKQYREDNLSTD